MQYIVDVMNVFLRHSSYVLPQGMQSGIKHPAQKFQTSLFLNSPANLQSLWVITTRITMLIV